MNRRHGLIHVPTQAAALLGTVTRSLLAHALATVVWTLRLAHALGNDSSAAVYVQDAEPAWKRRASNDLLSDLLRLVRLTGALMFEVGVRGWWGFVDDPTIEKFAPVLRTGTHHLISLGAVIEGRCRVRRAPDNWTAVPEGHAVVTAAADPHERCDRPGRAAANRVGKMLHGPSGRRTRSQLPPAFRNGCAWPLASANAGALQRRRTGP
jgi:hypothetical protein